MKKTKIEIPGRQGDVLLIKVDAMPKGIESAPIDPRGVVLAEGETSAHYHVIDGGEAKAYRFVDRNHTDLVLELKTAGATRVVGGGSGDRLRHLPIAVDAGIYRVRGQKRNDSGRVRAVKD